ncbi:MAG: hypothetical protein OQL06_10970 [Gammaproteobacteria bacterium]|nr:hypothetical protein [Gammaproteobacteria bacterium]
MSDSCTCEQISKTTCPECGNACTSVSDKTLRQHLNYPLNTQIKPGNYFFCSTLACEVGYFSSTGILARKNQLREFNNINQGWLCYCFDISRDQYIDDLLNKRDQETLAFVIEQTRSGQCACEVRNPSGQCCLADFKKIKAAYNKEHSNIT